MNCKRCNEKVSDGAFCSSCRHTYHFHCASLSEIGWRRLGNERQNSWCCPDCRNTVSSGESTKSSDDPSPYQSSLKRIEEMLSPLSLLPDKVEKLRNDLNDLTSKINANVIEDIYKRLEDIDLKLSLVDRINEDILRVKSQMKGFEDRLSKYETEAAKSRNTINNLQMTVTSLESEQKRTEQKSRFLNVEIVGLPEDSNENLLEIFLRLGTAINCNLSKEDIEFITRVQSFRSKKDSPRKIVAKLKDKLTKDTLINNFKKCNKAKGITSRDLGFTGNSMKIFINEHLTIANKILLNTCKLRAKERNIKFVWVKNCTIYLRANEKAPAKVISSDNDLKDFLESSF